MPNIELDLYNDLATVNGKLDVKIAPGSTLVVRNNGLFANAPKGLSGDIGVCYSDGIQEGIKITNKIVSTTNVVHHMFTATDAAGQNLTNFRSEVDIIYPGDMYRVLNGEAYDYYLITTVDSYGLGNITNNVYLGSW